jgi:hypothetical protein
MEIRLQLFLVSYTKLIVGFSDQPMRGIDVDMHVHNPQTKNGQMTSHV